MACPAIASLGSLPPEKIEKSDARAHGRASGTAAHRPRRGRAPRAPTDRNVPRRTRQGTPARAHPRSRACEGEEHRGKGGGRGERVAKLPGRVPRHVLAPETPLRGERVLVGCARARGAAASRGVGLGRCRSSALREPRGGCPGAFEDEDPSREGRWFERTGSRACRGARRVRCLGESPRSAGNASSSDAPEREGGSPPVRRAARGNADGAVHLIHFAAGS